jgi:membrane fusion protein, multidrug efflux system
MTIIARTYSVSAGRRAVLLLAATAVAALGACRGSDAATQDSAGAQAMLVGPENIHAVGITEIRTGPTISGTLQPERVATVRAELGGSVIAVSAEPGQRVQRGQLIARLDDAAISDAVLSSRSALATAENSYEIAQREVRRAQTLADAGAIAERQLEQARNGAQMAATQLANARAGHANARKQLEKTRIVAPIAGIVSARTVNAGDVVVPGAPVVTVVDPSSLQLEAAVPADQLVAVRLGMPVEFTVTGQSAQRITGRVTRINPVADAATRQVRIVVAFPNKRGTLVGGLFAEGRVASETRTMPVIPVGAVDQSGLRPVVMTIRRGVVARAEVDLGIRDAVTEMVEVRRGLSAGDTVLLGAARGISAGTPVRVTSPAGDVRSTPAAAPAAR